jgi:uncharacterized protein (UPF0548 family)
LRAREHLLHCRMLQLNWLEATDSTTPVQEQKLIGTLVHLAGLYSLNVARVVYVDDKTTDRVQFGYGTLPMYPLSGEERFTVSLDRDSDEVWFEIYSFARPASLLTNIGWPAIRWMQRKFCRDTTALMRQLIES